MSRQRLHTKMPETVKELRKKKDHKEFFKVNAFYYRTLENAFAFLYGLTLEDFLSSGEYHEGEYAVFKPPPEQPHE